VIKHVDQPDGPFGHTRYLADHIPGATYVELPGADSLYWACDTDAVLDEIERFVTGLRGSVDDNRILATILFVDIVDSTGLAVRLGDRRWRELLELHAGGIDRCLDQFRGRRVKDTGDGCMATFDGPARAIRCACAIRDAAQPLGIQIRAGLHTGEIEARGQDIGGIAVHTAARVARLASPNAVVVTRTVVDLVAGAGIEFEDQGERELKGVPGHWRLFQVGAH
jgi:class 3 adenylate cyclase